MTNHPQRRPSAVPPSRIQPLAVLPLFHKLAGRKVVVAGDTEGALWKAELLAAAGADVQVFARSSPELFAELAAHPPAGTITLWPRRWQPADLEGSALAIADIEAEDEARAFVAAGHANGAVVNIIDRPEFCDAQFGAIVNRSPLVISISTDGAAPVFGQAIRRRIEALLPTGLKSWAEAARDWRPAVKARVHAAGLGYASRRRFWERFTDAALSGPEARPTPALRDRLMSALDQDGLMPRPGRVTLVGAGPGDPDLLTIMAIRALQSADIILHDDLVSAEVLELARREARRMLVGKTGHGPSCKQSDINGLMVSLARQGRHVVRLKSGDPLVFGRATEELEACRQAGIAVSIVPGITAAQGAAAALGVSLTERRMARRVQYLTGHGTDGELPSDIAWAAIADPAVTTVLYMPRATFRAFADAALRAGMARDMPAIAVQSATRADERRICGTITTLPDLMGSLPDDGPVLVMIGRALRHMAVLLQMEGTSSGQDHATLASA